MQAVAPSETTDEPSSRYGGGEFLVLYDGVCGLCNRSVQFLLKRDRRGRFRYAPLQSELASELLARHGRNAADLNTFYLVFDPGGPNEQLFIKAKGILRALRELGGLWSVASWLGILPAGFLDAIYDFVARNRYRWFGKLEACPLPSKEDREKFLGL